MAWRTCNTCGDLTQRSGKCEECSRESRKERGSRQQQGYGAEYMAQLKVLKDSSPTQCSQCGEQFTDDNPMTGGHNKAIRNGGTIADGLAPHCRKCNYGWRRTGL